MGLFGMAISYIGFSILHFFQFVLAVTVCGLYAVDLDSAHKQGKYTDGKWVSFSSSPTPSLSCACAYVLTTRPPYAGLRRRRRRPIRRDVAVVPDPVHPAVHGRDGLERRAVRAVDRALRRLRPHVYP